MEIARGDFQPQPDRRLAFTGEAYQHDTLKIQQQG